VDDHEEGKDAMNLETAQREGFGDHYLMNVAWTEEPPGLKLLLSSPEDPDRRIVEISFSWVSNLKINLDFSEYDGTPFVFQSELKELEKGWSFTLTFEGTPVGELSLTCAEVRVGELAPGAENRSGPARG
jgi:hypothetical protein